MQLRPVFCVYSFEEDSFLPSHWLILMELRKIPIFTGILKSYITRHKLIHAFYALSWCVNEDVFLHGNVE